MEKGNKGKRGVKAGAEGGVFEVSEGLGKAPSISSSSSSSSSLSAPYSAADRKLKSKVMAQKRRNTYKSIMDDLTQVRVNFFGEECAITPKSGQHLDWA